MCTPSALSNLAVAEGLHKAVDLAPSSGYLEMVAALSRLQGPAVTAEMGWRINEAHALFAQGFANAQDQGVGLGWRFQW